nr:MAG TPA: hypothetical protein [Caudoviricetes sp.]
MPPSPLQQAAGALCVSGRWGRLPVRKKTVLQMGLAAQCPNWVNRQYTAESD